MDSKNNIISLSGGKDSTAMLHMMIERGESIHSVIFFDTSWEFPQMYDHIDLVEKNLGIKIWRLQSRLPFEYWMFHRPIIARKGPMKGKIHRFGYGWPSPSRRWCTRQKVNTLDYFSSPIINAVQCIGFAANETQRGIPYGKKPHEVRFPLKEWGVTETDSLQYCYDKGYHWDGLYKHFLRVSCYCCPLQRIGELRALRKYYPDLWQKTLDMDRETPDHNVGFKDYRSVLDFEKRFADEDRQIGLGLPMGRSPCQH